MDTNSKRPALLVIGGGAAGFFSAIQAARRFPHLQVTLLEKSGKLLSKVRISGGGRCNVTHACFRISEMVKNYPRGARFLKKAFGQFFTTDAIAWFENEGVVLKTEADGRMFPVSDSSQTIIDCLEGAARKAGVSVRTHAAVEKIQPVDGGFRVLLRGAESLSAEHICIACGGFPKRDQFTWLEDLGHTIVPPVPSLFTFNLPGHPIRELMGLSLARARVKIAGTKFSAEGPVLITHWGLSGPGVLRLSAYAARELAEKNWQFTITLNSLPDQAETAIREQITQFRQTSGSRKIRSHNPFQLPARFWYYLFDQLDLDAHIRWGDLPARAQNRLIEGLLNHSFEVRGKTTFKEEFVTAGGVALEEVDPSTMKSKRVPGLSFAGEILDIDGVTGGFNFQNAWTTGFIAGSHIIDRPK